MSDIANEVKTELSALEQDAEALIVKVKQYFESQDRGHLKDGLLAIAEEINAVKAKQASIEDRLKKLEDFTS